MGSAADLNYSKEIERVATRVGELIALSGNTLIYGAEKDSDSLSTCASRGAKSRNGLTVGITYGKGLNIWDRQSDTDVVIATGLERGGGREFVLVNSCDVIILISGGSGTLTEAAIAYQSNIPMVAIKGSAGWADELCGRFLDQRERIKVLPADTPEEAVESAIRLANASNPR